uniref:NADH dehydrogenase subunit 6 n=1 Tax=Balta hwangorum TaxID=2163940 RepID=UPI00279CAD54|nr:NADH dehydrogenase subunit 6 [Balta hwangorum]WGO57090.1 NADH dehydrogenase subunit 6 [Balta hwangorum]
MTKMIMFMMMLTSITFTQLNHPMTLGMMLLLQTMMISMLSGLMSQTFWFSYVLMLVFLGGMMVLFIYVTSIASNEIMKTSMKMFIMMTMTTTLVMSIMNPYLEMNNQETMNTMMMNMNTNESLMKLYNNPTNSITIMMASYLFITLIAVVKLTNIFKGPLRKMN